MATKIPTMSINHRQKVIVINIFVVIFRKRIHKLHQLGWLDTSNRFENRIDEFVFMA